MGEDAGRTAVIRLAERRDAEGIARVQVAAWRAAYAGIVSAAFLDGLDVADRVSRWRTRIGPAMRRDAPTFVAADATDAVLGFAHTGPARDDDLDATTVGEIHTIYVDPIAWRAWHRRVAHGRDRRVRRSTEVRDLVVWVFDENADARAFYERLGWRPDGATEVDDFGDAHPSSAALSAPTGLITSDRCLPPPPRMAWSSRLIHWRPRRASTRCAPAAPPWTPRSRPTRCSPSSIATPAASAATPSRSSGSPARGASTASTAAAAPRRR